MNEIDGVSLERQRKLEQQLLSVIEVKKKWHIPPGFNAEFVSYYHDRDSRIGDLRKALEEQVKVTKDLKAQEMTVR